MGRLSDADAEQIADEVGDGQSGHATEHHLITASRGEPPPIRALLAPVRTSAGSTAMKVLDTGRCGGGSIIADSGCAPTVKDSAEAPDSWPSGWLVNCR